MIGYNARLDQLRDEANPADPVWALAGKLEAKARAVELGIPVPATLAGPVEDARELAEPAVDSCVLKANEGAAMAGVFVLERTERGTWRNMVKPSQEGLWGDWCKAVQAYAVPGDGYVTLRARSGDVAGPFFVEEQITPGEVPVDFKVVCLGGEAQFVLQIRRAPRRGMVNRNLWRVDTMIQRFIPLDPTIERPLEWQAMIDAAEQFARTVPAVFCRVDLFDVNGPVFGELTVYPGPGYPVVPTWDYDLGEIWEGKL